MKHSELPWKISGYRPFRIIARDPKESTYEKGDDKFPEIANVSGSLEQMKANAQFIVKACNEHYKQKELNDKLLKALKEAHRQMCYAAKTDFMDDDYHEAINTVRQAIKEAS